MMHLAIEYYMILVIIITWCGRYHVCSDNGSLSFVVAE
uniref:Uncharacterized protein n=1 Tax=Yersinia ruckeri TaxID=29486 RepID=A0A0A8VFE1_YERRU|nr:hypothetical protein CSF007_2670 [Yersinia ruckeri]